MSSLDGPSQVEALLACINDTARSILKEYEACGQVVPTLDSTQLHPLDIADDTLALKKAIRMLEGACGQLCCTLAPPGHTIINHTQNVDRECYQVVLEAKIADSLKDHPEGLHIIEISKKVNVEAPKLARILRLLASEHCFRELSPDVFANNRLSNTLMSSNPIGNLGHMHTLTNGIAAPALNGSLKDPLYAQSYVANKAPFMHAIKSREPNVNGAFYDWLKLHPGNQNIFGQAMIGLGVLMGSLSVLNHYPWSNASTVCDVGSGIGGFALPLAKKFPSIQIILHDLPETIEQAREVWVKEYPSAIQSGRVTFAPGNFFVDVPAARIDIYYLRNIIHNWPDETAQIILHNVAKAMGPHSRVLIHDYVVEHATQKNLNNDKAGIEQAPQPLLSNFGQGNIRLYNQDITMLLTHNSKERTLEELSVLGKKAGMHLVRVWDMGEACMVEFKLANAAEIVL